MPPSQAVLFFPFSSILIPVISPCLISPHIPDSAPFDRYPIDSSTSEQYRLFFSRQLLINSPLRAGHRALLNTKAGSRFGIACGRVMWPWPDPIGPFTSLFSPDREVGFKSSWNQRGSVHGHVFQQEVDGWWLYAWLHAFLVLRFDFFSTLLLRSA